MNIVLVSSFDDKTPATYLLNSFKKRGIKVLTIGTSKLPFVDEVRRRSFKLNKILADRRFVPDLLIYIEGGSTSLFPSDINQLNFPTAWWGIDTHNNYEQHLMLSRIFDHSLIAQKSYVSKLSQDGILSVSWLPLAAPEYNVESVSRSKKYDIAYVGSIDWHLYPERKKIYEMIKCNFTKFYFGPASPKEMMEIYSQSKIVVNHSLMNDVNMRIFESIGAGSLLLTNEIHENGLEDLLAKGTNFDTYFDLEDLMSKINFYLENETIRADIAKAGHEIILKNHTYDSRVNFILEKDFAKSNEVKVRTLDLMNVLISLNYLAESFDYFLRGLTQYFIGRRNKTINTIFLFFAKPILYFLKVLSFFIYGSNGEK